MGLLHGALMAAMKAKIKNAFLQARNRLCCVKSKNNTSKLRRARNLYSRDARLVPHHVDVSSLNWLADAWTLGTTDVWCPRCSRRIIFSPDSLGLVACNCNR